MQTLIAHLEAGRKSFLAGLHGLSPTQWAARSGVGGWSIFEVTEHVATVEIGCHLVLRKKLLDSPCSPEQKLQVANKDDLIVEAMRDRSTKRLAPDPVKPSGRWPTPAEAVAAFDRARLETMQWLENQTRNLRDFCVAHPSFKTLDGHQWVLFMIEHASRHEQQIREIKADPCFPPAG
jgi:DinB superfamily